MKRKREKSGSEKSGVQGVAGVQLDSREQILPSNRILHRVDVDESPSLTGKRPSHSATPALLDFSLPDLFHRPGGVFGNERIVITGELIQDRQILRRPHIPQGDTDVPDESRPFDALHRRVAEKSTELVVGEKRELTQSQCLELRRKLEPGITGLLSKAVPRTDFQAIVTTVNSITYGSAELHRDRALVLNRKVGNTPPSI